MLKCILCQSYSFPLICKKCQKTLLVPSIRKRILADGFVVYSFYPYKEIEQLLKSKHTHIGASIYKILSRIAMKTFASAFSYTDKVYAIAIDDRPKSGYAHTAILTRAMQSSTIHPIYNKLRAQNSVSYAGKSLAYREANPRNFRYDFKSNIDVILVDDIVTTGTTLLEAKKVLEKHAVTPLFAITLADAREP